MTKNSIPTQLPNWILREAKKKKGKRNNLPFENRNIEEDRERIKKSLREFRFEYSRGLRGFAHLPYYGLMRDKIIEMMENLDKDRIYFKDKDEIFYTLAHIIDSFWYMLFLITNFDFKKYAKAPKKGGKIFLQENPHLKDEKSFLRIFAEYLNLESRRLETFLMQLKYDRSIIDKSIIMEANEKYIKKMSSGKYTLKDAVYDAVLEAILKDPRKHYLFYEEILLNGERTLRDYRSSLSKKPKKSTVKK